MRFMRLPLHGASLPEWRLHGENLRQVRRRGRTALFIRGRRVMRALPSGRSATSGNLKGAMVNYPEAMTPGRADVMSELLPTV